MYDNDVTRLRAKMEHILETGCLNVWNDAKNVMKSRTISFTIRQNVMKVRINVSQEKPKPLIWLLSCFLLFSCVWVIASFSSYFLLPLRLTSLTSYFLLLTSYLLLPTRPTSYFLLFASQLLPSDSSLLTCLTSYFLLYLHCPSYSLSFLLPVDYCSY